jgi:hypothetical protein
MVNPFRILRTTFAVVALTALVASCTPASGTTTVGSEPPSSHPTTMSTSTTNAEATTSTAMTSTTTYGDDTTVLDVADAVPIPTDTFELLFDYQPLIDDDTVSQSIIAVSTDGVFLGSTSEMLWSEELAPESPTLTDSSGETTVLSVPESDVAYQAPVASSGGGVFVWRETSSTSLFFEDYRILAARPGDTAVTVVADSAGVTPDGTVLPMLADTERNLATDGVNVYWTAATPVDAQGGFYSTVLNAHAVDGSGATTVLADNVVFPVLMGDTLLAVRYPGFDPDATEGFFEVVQVDTRDGGVSPFVSFPVSDQAVLLDICATPEYLALAVSDRIEIRYRSAIDTVSKVVKVDGDGTKLGCGDSFLVWGNGSGFGDNGQYLLDLDTDDIYKLGSLQGGSIVMAAGDYFAWTKRTPDVILFTLRAAKWLE